MSPSSQTVFRPVEGAIVDLKSLEAISAASDVLLSTWLQVTWPKVEGVPRANGLILQGLEMEGTEASLGPPGTITPNSKSEVVTITAGKALVTDVEGRRYLIDIHEDFQVPWPNRKQKSAVQGVLVLEALAKSAKGRSGGSTQVVFAREVITAKFGFIRPDSDLGFRLPLAASVGNGKDWALDMCRIWQPEHPAMSTLLKRFEGLERTVWRAEPSGSVWDRQVLGRNWVRYQTVAAAAIQATRIALASRATTTLDRVRLLDGLFIQLHNSVDGAATELLQLMGPAESAGPYGYVGASTLRGSR